jgi:hypothetical protein
MVAQVKSQGSSQIGNQPTLANGSNAFGELQATSIYKCAEAEKVSRVLRFSSPDRVVQGLADRIFLCAAKDNNFIAEDLHSTETGELFNGKGQLWSCNSRICPICIAKLSNRNRKKARYIVENAKLFLGEHWFFITLTQPDLALEGLTILQQRAVMYYAHRKFYRSRYWKKLSRGSIKNEEFTVGSYRQFHYHIHLLAILLNRVTSDNFIEIRRQWTKALKAAFKKYGIIWKCDTKDGLANLRVQKVKDKEKEKAILEVCKYFTKSDSWTKVPAEQLADIATIKRMPRMFETYDLCQDLGREYEAKRKKNVVVEPPNADTQAFEGDENPNDDAYFNKKKITVNFSHADTNQSNAPPKKKLTWRELCRILPRREWLKYLDSQIEGCREWRKRQLRHRFAFATFQTLDGLPF